MDKDNEPETFDAEFDEELNEEALDRPADTEAFCSPTAGPWIDRPTI